MSQYDEDMCWSLYCASIADSFSDTGSFEDFLKNLKTPTERNGQELDSKQIQKQLDNANKLLSGFVPPTKGGS